MKPKKTILGSLIALGLGSSTWALPQDPTPVQGQVQIQNGANFVQILQQSPQAIINWNQFNIGLGETVRFLQPSQQAAILNRVTGLDPSVIQGLLQANGRVFLLNPNGILFGPNSVVDVGSFTASTLKMSNEDFLNGTYKLTQDNSLPLAALTNQGTIRVADGGFVVLVSPLLDNQGMILAQSGHVNLGATTQATFSVDGRGLVQFVVPDGFDPQFRGGGQGGTVLLQPGQMSSLLSQVVTNPTLVEAGSFQPGNNGQVLAHGAEGVLLNSGTISTDSTTGNGGTIRLDSSQATILPAGGLLSANSQAGSGGDVRLLSAGRTVSLGSISAAANGTGNGGFAEVSGKDLWLWGTVNVGSAQGTGGTVLLDPTDITIIDGAGGTFDGQLPNPNGAGAGSVSVTAMQGQSAVQLSATHDVLYNGAGFNLGSTSLSVNAGNDIQFTTGGSILATTLTLMAGNDISIISSNGLTLGSTAGAFSAQAGRNVALSANGAVTLTSPVQTSVTATAGHLSLSSTQSTNMVLDAPRTNLSAGGNLTLTASDVVQSVNNPINMSARNVTLQSLPGGSFNYRTGGLNVTAGENFVGNSSSGFFSLRTFAGPVNISAGSSLSVQAAGGVGLLSDTGQLTLIAPNLAISTQTGGMDLRGAQGANVTASSGDASLVASSSGISLASSAGTVNVTANRDVNLLATGPLSLSSSGGTRVEAGRHLTTTSSQSANTLLDGPRTDLIAGQNLTIVASDIVQSVNNPVNLNARNVTMQSLTGGSANYRVGAVNITAAEDFVGRSDGFFSLRSFSGPVNVTAGGRLDTQAFTSIGLTSDTGQLTLNSPSMNLGVQTGGIDLRGAQGVNVTASSGDASLVASNSGISLASSAGTVNVTANRDVNLLATGPLSLSSSGGTRVEAGRHLTTTSSQSANTLLDGPRTDLIAGQNLTIVASDIVQSVNNPVNLNARNVTMQSLTGGSANYRVGAVNITAAEDFVGRADGFFSLRSFSGPVNVTAGGRLDTQAFTSIGLTSDTGQLTLNAPSMNLGVQTGGIDLRGAQGVNVTASSGDASLVASNSGISLASSAGTVNVTANRDVNLLATGPLSLSSSGGTRVEAGRHLTTTSSQSANTLLDGPRTDLIAGQNLTIVASDIVQSFNNPVNLNARNVTMQSLTGGSANYRVGAVNITAAEDFVGRSDGFFSLRSLSGPLNLTVGGSLNTQAFSSINLASETGQLTVTAPSAALGTQNSIDLRGAQGVNVTASNGDASLVVSNGGISLASSAGTVNVTASRDVNLLATGPLSLSSSGGTRVEAGRHLTTTSSQSANTLLDGPRTDLIAGQNLTITASDIVQSVNNPVFLSGQNVTMQSLTGGSANYRVGALNITAVEDFVGRADGFFVLRSLSGPIQVTAGANFGITAGGSKQLQADTGGLEVTGGNLVLSNVGLVAGNNGDVKLASAGNLSVGSLAIGSTANATLTGANITIDSMQNISGGNYTITTPGNLTEINPATNPPSLTGLNITAGKAFNFNRADLGFSIPNAGFLAGLVTGGNETLPAPNDARAASFHTFTTNPNDFDPGHVEFQTGDIYRDGVKIYGGTPPPDPPTPPPAPPPTPNPPPAPIEIPVTTQEAVQQQNALSPEQRSQILAQSNLALGNLGSFSRVLSESERQYLTTRHDALHQTWALDPFSPTLALTVPGGEPPVYPSELAQLTALLMMSSPSDDPEDKTNQAYNVIVDQELREIWEVRYWRHLLEDIIIWEDRE